MKIASYNIDNVNSAIPESKGNTVIIGTGGLKLTIETILKVVKENYLSVENFAKEIQGNTLAETSYNIWHFIKTNIVYKKDKPGYEEIRTPQRTLNEKIGDCEDYSILVAAVLSFLGYKPYFYIVAFSGKENYGHIYVGVNDLVIDGVMNDYGKHPDNITKYMIVETNGSHKSYKGTPKYQNLSTMIIETLSGLGSTEDKDSYITDLYDSFSTKEKLSGLSEIEQENFNKIKLLKLLEGSPHRDFIETIMPAMAGIDGITPYFADEETANEADQYLTEYLKDYQLNGIDGLGRCGRFCQKRKQLAKWAQKKAKSIKAKLKAGWKKVKKVAKKVAKLVVKVSLAPARAPFLLLMRMNFLYWSSKLYIGYLGLKQAKANHLNLTEWKKVVKAREKFERFWKKIGGNVKVLRSAIMKGGKKTAYKKYGLHGSNLGVVATATSASAASGILAVIGKFFKDIIWDSLKKAGSRAVKKVVEKAEKTIKEKIHGQKKQTRKPEVRNNIPGYTPVKSDDNPNPAPTPSGGSSKGLLIAGAIVAAFMLMK